MTGPSPPPTSEIHLREQAADWHVRLGSDLAGDADWLAFEAWLAESPAHGRAYDGVEALWSALDELPSSAMSNLRTLRTRPRLEVWLGLAAAGLVAALALAFTLMGPSHLDSYVTARGEQRQIALADGSRLVLNGGSRLTVRLSRHERRVVMADAEALFDVAKDPDNGKLSNRTPDEQQGEGGGHASKKRSPGDFALWKSAKAGEPSVIRIGGTTWR